MVPNAAAILLVGARSAPIPLTPLGMGPCTLDVFPLTTNVPLTLDGLGRVRLTVTIPDSLGLVGVQLSTQGIVADPGTLTPTKLVMSNAMETTIGGDQ